MNAADVMRLLADTIDQGEPYWDPLVDVVDHSIRDAVTSEYGSTGDPQWETLDFQEQRDLIEAGVDFRSEQFFDTLADVCRRIAST